MALDDRDANINHREDIMFKKVLILSASSGAGHIRAAQAIERAIRKKADE